MPKLNFYVDIHAHPCLRAIYCYDKKENRNLWDNVENKEYQSLIARYMRRQTMDIKKYSQSNFTKLSEGKVRVVFDNLYPVEKGWLNYRNLAKVFFGKKGGLEVFVGTTGIKTEEYRRLQKSKDYFKELVEQYDFLNAQQGKAPNKKNEYYIASNYKSLKEHIKKNDHRIVVIPCIEGAHSFGAGNPNAKKLSLEEHKILLSKNIAETKHWEHPPFYVTFAHHFWNQLCGHSKSLKPPTNIAFNQDIGLNTGITQLGWHVIKELLTNKNGRRILIDTKHMSAKARSEYYDFIHTYNSINPYEKIPIICSHAAVSTHANFLSSVKEKDSIKKMGTGYHNRWSINMSNEEIRLIHDSEGLIGVILDKTVTGGISTIDRIKAMEDKNDRKEAYLRLIWSNIFHIIKVSGDISAWDRISLGSDYDGLINSFEDYPDASYLPQLHKDMINFLNVTEFKKELWYNYDPSTLVYKIFTRNAMDFLEKHYK